MELKKTILKIIVRINEQNLINFGRYVFLSKPLTQKRFFTVSLCTYNIRDRLGRE